MKVDFYHLAGTPVEQVVQSLAEKVLAAEGRLIVVAQDELFLAKLDRMLWDLGPLSFLPHAAAGGPDDARQPILLSTGSDAPNFARNFLIADGIWRDAALNYDRSFYLFDESALAGARSAWRDLAAREGVERLYWAKDGGKWKQQA